MSLALNASAQSVTTTPVGAVTAQVTAGAGAGSLTFLGFPLVRSSIWQGSILTATGTVLNLPAGALASTTLSGIPHYLIVTEGTNIGLMVDVVSNTSDTVTLSEDVSGLIAATNKISIRPHWTLASLFGSNNTAGFGASFSIAAADEIRVFNPTTQSFVNYYYKSSGLGGTGWRSSTSTSADRSKDVIYPEQSIAILRKQSAPISIVTVGEVYSGAMKLPVETGIAWVINTKPIPTTLAELGFYTGTTTGLNGSNTITNADEVLRWTGTGWERFYYKTAGLGGTGWRTASSTSLDRGSQQIQPGEAILVNRKSTPILLTRPSFDISL
jgi:uncharacterized protein (TIGR02597 family)